MARTGYIASVIALIASVIAFTPWGLELACLSPLSESNAQVCLSPTHLRTSSSMAAAKASGVPSHSHPAWMGGGEGMEVSRNEGMEGLGVA